MLEEIRACELEILRAFQKVADELGIRYYAAYGTLLGAVRHGGFIPWDDDIDLFLPRPDYERFLKEAPALLPKHLFLQHLGSEKNYLLAFAKIRDSRTTFVETPYRNYEMNHGIFIDLFPLDGFDSALLSQRLRVRKNPFEEPTGARKFLRGLSSLSQTALFHLAPLFGRWVSLRKQSLSIERRAKQVSIEAPFWADMVGSIYVIPLSAKLFGEGVLLPYEDGMIRAPIGYDEILRKTYGDYEKLPPEKDRKPHHDCSVIDPGRPYDEILKGQGDR